MLSTQKALSDLIADAHITLTAERTDSNPNMDSRDMDHWKVVLSMPFKDQQRGMSTHHRMTTYFSMGYGLNGREPDVDGVLDCLLSDSSALDEDFESWCSDLGYDTDSRTAERTFKACQKSGEKLRKFLGPDLFERMRYADR